MGDLHVLDDPSYRIKVTKADKIIRQLENNETLPLIETNCSQNETCNRTE